MWRNRSLRYEHTSVKFEILYAVNLGSSSLSISPLPAAILAAPSPETSDYAAQYRPEEEIDQLIPKGWKTMFQWNPSNRAITSNGMVDTLAKNESNLTFDIPTGSRRNYKENRPSSFRCTQRASERQSLADSPGE
jgi:hypothetical protein